MQRVKVAILLVSFMFQMTVMAQIRAGSAEGDLFDRISHETNPDAKLELVASFEKQFPTSKILSKVYLSAVDVYRQKDNREKTIEFGEKALRLEPSNVTAMMIVARNYAIESKSIDRALDLAQRAVDSAVKLRSEPVPPGYSETQWKDYVKSNEDAAGQILSYVKAVKGRMDTVAKAPTSAAPANTSATTDVSQK
jgi:hypothetical protein